MNKETIKTFILSVLVGLSFLLSYILWSYQPKYDMFYNTSYVNEVDVGGSERIKSDLIKPKDIIFHRENSVLGFKQLKDQEALYKDMIEWEFGEFNSDEHIENLDGKDYVEVIFPHAISVELLAHLAHYDDTEQFPNWTFERLYFVLNEKDKNVRLLIPSADGGQMFQALNETSSVFNTLFEYDATYSALQPLTSVQFNDQPIYIPHEVENLAKKTLVAHKIEPESFINVLFNNPSLVKPNRPEAYFSDGQRGMRMYHENRYMEFIHPIQSNDVIMNDIDLFENSIEHINEHKGWMNDYVYESVNPLTGEVIYRLHYDGLPVFDYLNISQLIQIWRDQDLYQYHRPLVYMGNQLNYVNVELPGGDEVISYIIDSEDIENEAIKDITVGYSLRYLDEEHSFILEPAWYMKYEQEWIRINFEEETEDVATIPIGETGEDN